MVKNDFENEIILARSIFKFSKFNPKDLTLSQNDFFTLSHVLEKTLLTGEELDVFDLKISEHKNSIHDYVDKIMDDLCVYGLFIRNPNYSNHVMNFLYTYNRNGMSSFEIKLNSKNFLPFTSLVVLFNNYLESPYLNSFEKKKNFEEFLIPQKSFF